MLDFLFEFVESIEHDFIKAMKIQAQQKRAKLVLIRFSIYDNIKIDDSHLIRGKGVLLPDVKGRLIVIHKLNDKCQSIKLIQAFTDDNNGK